MGLTKSKAAAAVTAAGAGIITALAPTAAIAAAVVGAFAALFVRNAAVGVGLLTVGAAFMLRPTAAGQSATPLALSLLIVAAVLTVCTMRESAPRRLPLIVFAATSVLWSYLVLHASVLSATNFEFALKAGITHVVALAAAVLILRVNVLSRVVFKGMIVIMALAGASWAITIALSTIVPFESIYLFRLPIEGYSNAGDTFFPITTLYGYMTVGDVRLPRLLGWFREPGIFQAFCIWGLFTARDVGLTHPAWGALLLLAALATFSTAALVLLPATAGLAFFLSRSSRPTRAIKVISPAVFTGFCYWLFVHAPFVGLRSKSLTHAASIDDRVRAVSNAIHTLDTSPWGLGLYGTTQQDSGINLLAQTAQIGFVGFIFFLFVVGAAVLASPNGRRAFVAFFPILLTALAAQPLLDAPLLYIALMAPRIPPAKESKRLSVRTDVERSADRKKLGVQHITSVLSLNARVPRAQEGGAM